MNAMRTRPEYDRAVQVVRGVIHAWDPYGLISGGAPDDEWDDEIARIVAGIPKIGGEDDAASLISQVFTQAFQPQRFGHTDCYVVGCRLFDALKASGLLA